MSTGQSQVNNVISNELLGYQNELFFILLSLKCNYRIQAASKCKNLSIYRGIYGVLFQKNQNII